MESIGGSKVKEASLGVKGQFTMSKLPFPVSFVSSSVLTGDIEAIEDFIFSLVR
jgi:hypothetical protein